jgi:amino acid permease
MINRNRTFKMEEQLIVEQQEDEVEIRTKQSSKASLATTSFNLVNNMVGSGLLSIPWCIKQLKTSGIGLTMLALLAFVTWSSFALIGLVCSRVRTIHTFDDLSATAGFSKTATKILLALYTCLSCISYVLLTCDFVAGESGLARYDWSCTRNENCSWLITPFKHRYVVVIFLIFFVLYPFSLYKDFNSLKIVSYISFLAMVCMMVVAVYMYVKHHDDESERVDDFYLLNYYEPDGEFHANPWLGMFLAHPIFLISFTAHYNAPRLFSELENASSTRFALASAIAVFIAFLIYGFFGVISFETYLKMTKPDVLENYPGDAPIAVFARFAMAVVVLTTYPLAFQALKGAVSQFFDEVHSKRLDYALILCTAVPAMFIHDIGVVLDYKGSVFGGIVSLLIPATAYLRGLQTPILTAASDTEIPLTASEDDESIRKRSNRAHVYLIWSRVLMVWAIVASIGGFIVTTLRLSGKIERD